jgi:hypothetical protein
MVAVAATLVASVCLGDWDNGTELKILTWLL